MLTPETVDCQEALKWARERTKKEWKNFFRRRKDLLCYFRHQIMPGWFEKNHLSLRSLLMTIGRVIVIFALASAFYWRQIIKDPSTLTWNDVGAIIAIAILMFFSWVLDRLLSKQRRRRLTQTLEQQVSVELAQVIKQMSSFVALSETKAKSLAFTPILQCMEHRIRIYLQREDSLYFNVSLLVFTGPDGGDLDIKARSNHKRGLVFKPGKADQSAAYYVAKTHNVKVIDDFSKNAIFPPRGLSDASLPYRSVLLLPLDPVTIGGDSICRAVVSIDSERAYEFYGPTTDDIQVQMRPFLSVINMMLSAQEEGVLVDEQ